CAYDWHNCDLCDLLYRCDSLRGNSDSAAAICQSRRVWAFICSPVRSRLRCVGEFHATGIFAHFIVASGCATDINGIESVAGPTFVSGLIKNKPKTLILYEAVPISLRGRRLFMFGCCS